MTLLIFRARDKSKPKGSHFRLPLFPFEPIFFAIICGGLTYNSIEHLISEEYLMIFLAIGGLMIVGVVLGFLMNRISKTKA